MEAHSIQTEIKFAVPNLLDVFAHRKGTVLAQFGCGLAFKSFQLADQLTFRVSLLNQNFRQQRDVIKQPWDILLVQEKPTVFASAAHQGLEFFKDIHPYSHQDPLFCEVEDEKSVFVPEGNLLIYF